MLWQKVISGTGTAEAGGNVQFLGAYDQSYLNTTFTNVNFGSASASRRIYVIWFLGNNGTVTLSSASIGGISATKFEDITNTGETGNTNCYCFAADVPTGTSGTITASFNGSLRSINHSIAVWAVTDQVASLATANFGAANSRSISSVLSLTVTANTTSGGFGLVKSLNNGTQGIITYTNATYETQFLSTRSVATVYPPTDGNALTVTSTQTQSNTLSMWFWTFRP